MTAIGINMHKVVAHGAVEALPSKGGMGEVSDSGAFPPVGSLLSNSTELTSPVTPECGPVLLPTLHTGRHAVAFLERHGLGSSLIFACNGSMHSAQEDFLQP